MDSEPRPTDSITRSPRFSIRLGSWRPERSSSTFTNSINIREGILYSLVARNTAVLAKYGRCAGNFTEVSEQILAKISPINNKLSYAHGNFFFHYISDNGLTFLCITDGNFSRKTAFQFLEEIKNIFYKTYGSLGMTAMPYSMNTEFGPVLQTQMKRYSSDDYVPSVELSRGDTKYESLKSEVEEVKDIMVQTIDKLTNREENLELLVQESMELSYDSVLFQERTRDLKNRMFWKNVKISVAITVIVIVIIYLILTLACGGFTWSKCV